MFQASGWHAKTPSMQFVLCFTAKAGLSPQTPKQNQGFRQGVQGLQLGPAARGVSLARRVDLTGSASLIRRVNLTRRANFTDHSDVMD